jgi:sialate O-acetylesterase
VYLEKIRIGALRPMTDMPQPDKGPHRTWLPAGPQSLEQFSAVGYFFGRDLQKALDVPIGLIHDCMGSTSCERWISKDYVEANSTLREMKPTEGAHDLWNGMIFPVTQFPIKGVIWYQGEANVGRAWQYRTLLQEMINNWRNAWRNSNLPFMIVQLAPFAPSADQSKNDEWAELRDSQLYVALSMNSTALVATTDLGDEKDIHPPRKREVGERLALAALGTIYGKKITYSGPIYDKMAIHADNIVLTFKHVGSGLVAKDGPLTGFTLAGEDKKFYPAQAEIVGDTVIVWSDKVRRARAVRYGWSNFPKCNLFNKEGLPAATFRTDDYPLTTVDNK